MSDKQEMPKVAQNDTVFGNAASMREALKEIHQMGIDLRNIIPHLDKRWEVHLKAAINIYQTAERAYLSPPRQCDVGTPDEQMKRIDAFCKSHGTDQNGCYRCEECPLLKIDRCELVWAQMPYQEGENEGSK